MNRLDWERQTALKYYEIHVNHRTQLFNFILVFIGAAAVAYTGLLAEARIATAVVAGLSAVATAMFAAMAHVTLKKIDTSKRLFTARSEKLKEVYGSKATCWGCGDRKLKMGFYFLIMGAFCLGAVYAGCYSPSQSNQNVPVESLRTEPSSGDGIFVNIETDKQFCGRLLHG